MNLTDHDNLAQGAMPEPTMAQQAEYYRLYGEIQAKLNVSPAAHFSPSSRLIHTEVVRRMNIKDAS